ncbi:hypothetical protein KBD34_03035 [Patescibacteria group bacterium]|nr:hypothetical protein [Patescibacteria group bacterium]
MDRVMVSALLCLMAELLMPWEWRNGNYGLHLFLDFLIFLSGFLIYKPSIIRDNLRDFRKRWHWNVDRVKVLKDVVVLSWIVPLFAVMEITKNVLPSIWGIRVVITESVLLVAAALVILGRIVFLNDGDEMWPDHMWSEEDKRTSLWKNFDTLRYFFPLPLIGLVYLILKNGPGLIGNWYKNIAQKMHVFATLNGLDPKSNKGTYYRWWLTTLLHWSKSWVSWVLGVMKTVGIFLLHMGGRLLYWLLKPSEEFRLLVFLFDTLIFLVWAQAYKQNKLFYLLSGLLFAAAHVTLGYRLADWIERALDKSDKKDY